MKNKEQGIKSEYEKVKGSGYGASEVPEKEINGPKWTDEQLEAINLRNCNLLVAAAAGAGKTAVLVERIIKRITDREKPVDIDKILVVTFTNAAAAEMRERISDAISKELDKNPESKEIRRQMNLLGKASITTIHSFCMDVIRSHIQNIDLDPGFRVADDTECTLLRIEAMTELFEQQYEEERIEFTGLLESYGGNRNDQILQDMVMNLYHFIQSNPWPEQWLEEKTAALDLPEDTDFSLTPWGKEIIKAVRLELKGMINMLNRANMVLKYAEGLEKYIPIFQQDMANLKSLMNAAGEIPDKTEKSQKINDYWDRLRDSIHSMEFSRLPNAGKNADKEKQQYVKDIRDSIKDTINTRFKKKLFSACSKEIINDMKTLYPLMLCLARLTREFTLRYAEKKKARAILDFNDLEHLCLKILTEDNAAAEYRARFEEIMVDEYQDSNMVQEIILRTISRQDQGEPNIFMVGDVKQSIYRFRQAKPELFMEKYLSYSSEEGDKYRKILLYRNFRSRKEIVDAVNFIFGQIMSVNAGELDYTEKEALNAGADYPPVQQPESVVGGPVELHILQTDEPEEPDNEKDDPEDIEEDTEDRESLDKIQCEARVAAYRILELIQPDRNGKSFYVYDKKKKEYRKLEFKDIVILLRATKNWSEVYTEELSNYGIPVFADTGTGFFKTTEIQVVLSMLQIIDNPLQDIPLLSVLRSPIFGFTTDEMVYLRLADKKAALFDALCLFAEKARNEDGSEIFKKAAEKAAKFIAKLTIWREKASYMATDQLIWYLYQETGYYSMVGAMPEGELRQANLRVLYDRARQFEETSYKGLFNFINFVDKLKSSRGDMGSAKILGENDNVVRIMSIHKSKGLEFPVVILAGCGKRFNLMDMNSSILLHQELGFGPDVVDCSKRISWPSAAKLGIREKIKTENLSEEMRILYVAMTRAREKLIITGSVRNIEKSAARWSRTASVQDDKLLDTEMLRSTGFLDWIGPALLRHKGDDPGNYNEIKDLTLPEDHFTGKKVTDQSKWIIKVWNREDILGTEETTEQQDTDLFDWLENNEDGASEYRDEVNRRLSWSYMYKNAAKIPAKVTVTELKRRFDPEFFGDAEPIPVSVPKLVKKPLFLEEKKGLNAAEIGTVMHFVMQHLNFQNSDIEGQIEVMVKKELLTPQQAQSVRTDKIRAFLSSPIGRRMLLSPEVKREVPFNMEIPCSELYKDMASSLYANDTFLLQGIIDCYFEEGEGLVLLDYKTDFVPEQGIETIKERYRVQIDYYSRALNLLTGKKVTGRYIYLFYNGDKIEY